MTFLKHFKVGFAIGTIAAILLFGGLIIYAVPRVDYTEADIDKSMCIESPLPGCVLSPYPGARAAR